MHWRHWERLKLKRDLAVFTVGADFNRMFIFSLLILQSENMISGHAVKAMSKYSVVYSTNAYFIQNCSRENLGNAGTDQIGPKIEEDKVHHNLRESLQTLYKSQIGLIKYYHI